MTEIFFMRAGRSRRFSDAQILLEPVFSASLRIQPQALCATPGPDFSRNISASYGRMPNRYESRWQNPIKYAAFWNDSGRRSGRRETLFTAHCFRPARRKAKKFDELPPAL
jgi:hypothetical protein